MEQRFVLCFLTCRISTEEKKIVSPIKIFVHENNYINPSIYFFFPAGILKTQHKHNSDLASFGFVVKEN